MGKGDSESKNLLNKANFGRFAPSRIEDRRPLAGSKRRNAYATLSTMTTALFTHAACLEHDPGPRHPESPARLRAVLDALSEEHFPALARRDAPRATVADIAMVHSRPFIEALLAAVPEQGRRAVDPDTTLSTGSGEAALRAAGAVCAAIDAVMAGEVDNAFCAVRPPGHHAEPDRAMGFCLFNNIAIGAARARHTYNLERIGIVDFDVHHGNGTQAAFEADAHYLYASTHQSPLYPGTGAAEESGVGNIFNVALPPGSGSRALRAAFERTILPALDTFRPQFLFLSAGFDAHRADPLAGLELEDEDFAWVTHRLCECAARHAQGRVVSSLEGGYDLTALSASAAAHVTALLAA
jgi:acetoin utilization deacetylase AcuC-like enzyme